MTEVQNKGLLFETDIEFLEVSPTDFNPMVTKVKIRIAKSGANRNGFIIPKDVLDRAARNSLGLTPIVAYFDFYKGDFGTHGEQAVKDFNGEYITTADTQAVGVIPENPVIYWDEDDYLVTFGYLWTSRYEETIQALEGRPQSMELSEAHTIMKPTGSHLEILDTAFEGLCILGKDVPPAFEEASIEGITFSYINRDELNVDKKGEDKFMKDLKFALDHNFDDSSYQPPVIVDVDGEEKDKENREKVTTAIDTLDELANKTLDPEVVTGIDEALDDLVDAEIDMKKEAKIIPVTEEAVEGLKGQPTSENGIVSADVLNYASKKKEEEELATNKKKVEENNDEVVEQKVDETKKVEKTEPVAKPAVEKEPETKTEGVADKAPEDKPADTEENKPSGIDGASEGEPDSEFAAEKKPVSGEAMADPEGTIGEEADKARASVSQSNQGEAAVAISNEREAASTKRAGNLLADVSNPELLDLLLTRIKTDNEELMGNLASLLGTAMPANGLPESNPDGIHTDVETTHDDLGTGQVEDPSQIQVEEPDNEVDDSGANMPSDKGNSEMDASQISEEDPNAENDVETDTKEVNEEEVPANGEKVAVEKTVEKTEEVPVEQPEKEEEKPAKEDVEKTPEEEAEEKKKKPRFSLDDEDFDIRAVLSENIALEEENASLKAQADELLQFKLNIEKEEKEAVLDGFALSDSAKEDIRLNFSLLSVDEIEERAVVAQWKESKSVLGQKAKADSIQFSLTNEDIMPISESVDSIESVLAKAKAELQHKSV